MDTFDPAAEYLRIAERYRQMSDTELLLLVPQSSELTDAAQQALASEVRQRGLKLEQDEPDANAEPEQRVFSRHQPVRFGTKASSQTRADADPQSHSSSDRGSFARNSASQNSASQYSAGDDPANNDPASDDSSDEDSSAYDEDRELVEIGTVWSPADALQVQELLDRAGIPFFMGPEKAESVDAVTSNYANGVSVQVMRIGIPWAAQAMQYYAPADEPQPKQEEQPAELVVRCPQCNSADVVFEGGSSTLVFAGADSSQKYNWSCDSCGCEWEDDGIAKEE